MFVALAFYIGVFVFLVRRNNQHIKSSQQLLAGKSYQKLSANEQRLTDSLLQLFVGYQQVLQKLLKARQEHRLMFRSPQRNRIMKDWWADVTSQSFPIRLKHILLTGPKICLLINTMILSYIALLKQVSMLMSLVVYRCTLTIQLS